MEKKRYKNNTNTHEITTVLQTQSDQKSRLQMHNKQFKYSQNMNVFSQIYE